MTHTPDHAGEPGPDGPVGSQAHQVAGADRPRLRSRSVMRPIIDPILASTFARPAGVASSFAPTRGSELQLPVAPPVDEVLAEAFGRPAETRETIQRDPSPPPVQSVPPVTPDPWRDLNSLTSLGGPAELPPTAVRVEPGPAVQYSLRQALFERKLRPSAIAGLLVSALVIGAIGALIGSFFISRVPAPLGDPAFTLATVTPAVERPPGSVADVAARVSPSVVSIEIRLGDAGGAGSGIVIDKAGYILTNNHVAAVATTNGAQMSVVFADGSRVPATIVARDIRTDLAVIKVNADNLVVAQLGDSSKLAVGDAVIAIGSPLGLSGTVTTGIVSALNRPVKLSGEGSDTDAVVDAIQTDAPINPGNSGGALVDATGAVIGINSAIRTLGDTKSGSIGLGFAIPINLGREVAEGLIRDGKVQHATIGVDARSATDGTTLGAQVINVRDGSPAAQAGIEEGDVITKVGSRAVGNADELTVAVQLNKPGQIVPVELLRAGRSMTVNVTLVAE